jgi:hypothetical protein
LHALIDEGVLRRNIGGNDVMAAQLRHLLAAQELTNVELLVLPFGSDGHGALAGPLFILSYPEPEEPDEAYVESVIGLENVGDTQDVADLSAVWDEIAAAAPSPARSVEMIQERLARLER